MNRQPPQSACASTIIAIISGVRHRLGRCCCLFWRSIRRSFTSQTLLIHREEFTHRRCDCTISSLLGGRDRPIRRRGKGTIIIELQVLLRGRRFSSSGIIIRTVGVGCKGADIVENGNIVPRRMIQQSASMG